MVSSEIDSQFNTTMGITKQEVTAKQQEESRVLEAYANVKEALSTAQDDGMYHFTLRHFCNV